MSAKPVRTLVVDDERVARASVRLLLGKDPEIEIAGECASGVDAVRAIRSLLPDLVFLDIQMPQMNGLTVAREIRQQKLEVDVIFLTMYREENLFNEAIDIGARAYVLKDSAVYDILNAIHTVEEGKYYISPVLADFLMNRSARAEKLLRHTPSLEDLTPSELRILKLIAENKTSKEIANVLSISYKTVENHRTSIASKLHLRGSHSLLKFGLENRGVLAKK